MPGAPCTAGRPPVPVTRARRRFPDSSHVPEFPPVVSVSGGEVISTPSPHRPQESEPINFFLFPIHNRIHRKQAVIRIPRRFSTTLYTTRPQVTGREAGTTVIAIALCDRLILNCRLRVCSQPDRRHELRGCLRDAAVRERCGAPGRKYREDPASLEDFANHRGPDTPQRPDLPRKSGLFGLLHE